jgi:hypothetical protein
MGFYEFLSCVLLIVAADVVVYIYLEKKYKGAWIGSKIQLLAWLPLGSFPALAIYLLGRRA